MTNTTGELSQDFLKLSIQVSLNGLSFCILDTIRHKVLLSDKLIFEKTLSAYDVLKKLKALFEEHALTQKEFSEVIVIHQNPLFALVPKPLFDPQELSNYVRFNARILANDHFDFDEIGSQDMVNVYVPFVNVNNYIFEVFGEFVFKHIGTVLISSLLHSKINGKLPVCYVHITGKTMDLVILKEKRFLLYNTFSYATKTDFLYFILFALEQLDIDTENVILRLFGAIEEGDDRYELCLRYIRQVSIFVPSGTSHPFINEESRNIDFALLNSL
ncbi:MAG: DUF3822 family protein [Bacteroidota bacterium]